MCGTKYCKFWTSLAQLHSSDCIFFHDTFFCLRVRVCFYQRLSSSHILPARQNKQSNARQDEGGQETGFTKNALILRKQTLLYIASFIMHWLSEWEMDYHMGCGFLLHIAAPHYSTISSSFISAASLHSPAFHPVSISVSINGSCVSMATGFATGLWEVKECASARAKFICRQTQDTSLSPEPPVPQPTPSLSGSCPSGWKSNNELRYCYKVRHASAAGQPNHQHTHS